MKKSEIKLGQKVKCLVTGMEGIVVAHIHYLNGCHSLSVQRKPRTKDADMPETAHLDIETLEVISDGVAKKIKPTKTGGHQSWG